MLNRLKRTISKLQKGARGLGSSSDEILSVVILLLTVTIFSVALVRKVQEGNAGYQVHQSELRSLAMLQEENKRLQRELDYYTSAEYQLLYVRDSLNMVREGEQLYELPDEVKLYRYQEDKPDLYEELDGAKIWEILLFDLWM